MARRFRSFLFDNIGGKLLTGISFTLKQIEQEAEGTRDIDGTKVSDFAGSAIQTSSETFSDSDTVVMTAAAIDDRINASASVKANIADLSTVATSGSYTDLSNKPVLFDGAYSSLTGIPPTSTYGDTEVSTYLSGNGYDTATNIVASITASAPATLDTLNELAAALGDDPNFATTVTNSIGTKLPTASYTAADVLTKVKTVDGSGSGLDADLLDGQQGSYYRNASNINAGTLNNARLTDLFKAGTEIPSGANLDTYRTTGYHL